MQAFIRAHPGAAVDLSGAVELTHPRHEQQFTGCVALGADGGEVSTIDSGTGRTTDQEPEPLS